MSYNDKFQHDIFISYASVDKPWASVFWQELQATMQRLVGSQFTQYVHSADVPYDDGVLAALENSAILICIVTPEWNASGWSEKEIEAFQSAASKNEALRVQERIFRVIKNPGSGNGWTWEARLLGDTREFIFFEWSDGNFSGWSSKNEKFHVAMFELAQEITVVLKLLRDNVAAGLSATSETFDITFNPELSDYEIRTAFAALADYYRACGGIGLAIEHEREEIQTQEPANV